VSLAMIPVVVRCPYCVSGDEFRPMTAHGAGRFVCAKCSHLAMPDDKDFKSHCGRCEGLRWVGLRRCG